MGHRLHTAPPSPQVEPILAPKMVLKMPDGTSTHCGRSAPLVATSECALNWVKRMLGVLGAVRPDPADLICCCATARLTTCWFQASVTTETIVAVPRTRSALILTDLLQFRVLLCSRAPSSNGDHAPDDSISHSLSSRHTHGFCLEP